MWIQTTNPLENIGLSALAAAIPILSLFYALAVKRLKGYQAGLIALILALGVATLVYGMPIDLALGSGVYGAMKGLFPIGWIVFSAVLLYNLSVKSGHFEIVKNVIASITEDRRLQALLIGFCFGAFLEGSAGFGAPVAITAGLLVGLGFQPLYAAGLCLIANTAPVAFGGIGIAILTAGNVSDIDPMLISRMVAHQLPLLAFMVPFWLVILMSGWKGLKEVLPAVFITAGTYAATMYATASFVGPYLPDILSSVVSIASLVIFLRFWKPKHIWRFPGEQEASIQHKKYPISRQIQAWTPFILLVVLVGDWGFDGIKHYLDLVTVKFSMPFVDGLIRVGNSPMKVSYSFEWLSAAGTAILIATIATIIILQIRLKLVWETLKETSKELALPLVTIASVLAFAYIANFSGMTASLGKALTLTGAAFPFLSPFLGWLGVFITGSDTSSNALFCNMQRISAEHIGVNPVLTVAANTTGGVAAKMISPQSIAVATAATGLAGQEGQLFRFTVKHSLIFAAIMGVITLVQAYWLKGMVPDMAKNTAAAAQNTLGTLGITMVSVSAVVVIFLFILRRVRKPVHEQVYA